MICNVKQLGKSVYEHEKKSKNQTKRTA